jgi:GNAT superfamily N-acetyltransferase
MRSASVARSSTLRHTTVQRTSGGSWCPVSLTGRTTARSTSSSHVSTARASRAALDFRGDRGIYNVVTLEHFRRRGLGTALTARLVHDAFESGFQSASLQSTPIAERVYAAVGFRDLGRILEYVPSAHLLQPSAPPGP